MAQLRYELVGAELQALEVILAPGQSIRSEPGMMVAMETKIGMQTTTGGGMFQGLKRMLGGGGFFLSTFTNEGTQNSRIILSAPYPGKIIPLSLDAMGGSYCCHKDSFLCAESSVEIDITFTRRLGAGFFGGDGFILQRLHGSGLAFIHAGGTVLQKHLQANETLRVDAGSLVAFSHEVDFDIQFIGGFRNMLFGGEGLFFAKLTGPGTVYLQSLPLSRLADRIINAVSISRNK